MADQLVSKKCVQILPGDTVGIFAASGTGKSYFCYNRLLSPLGITNLFDSEHRDIVIYNCGWSETNLELLVQLHEQEGT